MNDAKRWLSELPLDARERQLLQAGKGASPPAGAVDEGWQELELALGAGAAASVAAGKAAGLGPAATSSASGTSAALGGKAAATGALVYAKFVAIGFGVAVGVLGTGSLLLRASGIDGPAPGAAIKAKPASPSSIASGAPPPRAEASAEATPAEAPRAVDSAAASAHKPRLAGAEPSSVPVDEGPATDTTLAEQARELAQIQRLVDAGATGEALRRLDASFARHAHSQLAEERDGLYVRALDQAGRHAEARSLARRFLVRYPNSPRAEKMRQFLTRD